MDDLKKKKETIKGDQGEPAKDPLTVKSNISIRLKYSEWMNSRTPLGMERLSPFYREFGLGLLVRCH